VPSSITLGPGKKTCNNISISVLEGKKEKRGEGNTLYQSKTSASSRRKKRRGGSMAISIRLRGELDVLLQGRERKKREKPFYCNLEYLGEEGAASHHFLYYLHGRGEKKKEEKGRGGRRSALERPRIEKRRGKAPLNYFEGKGEREGRSKRKRDISISLTKNKEKRGLISIFNLDNRANSSTQAQREKERTGKLLISSHREEEVAPRTFPTSSGEGKKEEKENLLTGRGRDREY